MGLSVQIKYRCLPSVSRETNKTETKAPYASLFKALFYFSPSYPHISSYNTSLYDLFLFSYLKNLRSSLESSSLCDSPILPLMGSSLSLYNSDLDGSTNSQSKTDLGDLPESCVASILGYLEPTDICRLARLNRAFRGASWADFVWESKLPSNYGVLVRKILGDSVQNLGKREIYARLCRPNSFDGGTKVCFALMLLLSSVCLVAEKIETEEMFSSCQIDSFDLTCENFMLFSLLNVHFLGDQTGWDNLGLVLVLFLMDMRFWVYCRKFGWKKALVVFAYPFLQMG